MNRLSRASSPYLLQHAHNPVDWFEWGPEALAAARDRAVPIFLSVGYSTCYWCHVMERESFEDPAVARFLADHFVSVKLDREERPDLDEITMAAAQLLTGSGGWPTTLFLTPPGAASPSDRGLKPFFAGTYYPPTDAHGRPSFTRILHAMHDAWTNQRAVVLEQADRLAEGIREHLDARSAPVRLGPERLQEAADTLIHLHDAAEGGFGRTPKFPQVAYLDFIADELPRSRDASRAMALGKALRLTLDRMAIGGLFDHLAGGFHRYCVDATWTVPHFEKMLYDQAQLLSIYARSHAFTRDPFERAVADRTAEFVLRDMTSPDGAFFSALDAEVDGREGANYVWTPDEVRAALAAHPDDAEFAISVYSLDAPPNFRDPHHPDAPPAHVLRLAARPEECARVRALSPERFAARLRDVNDRLLAARIQRRQPRLDDKIIASWCAMMAAALAEAGRLFDRRPYIRAAERAVEFILTRMTAPDGALRRIHRAGTSRIDALLEDYAHTIRACIALHRARSPELAGAAPLDHAQRLLTLARDRFADAAAGGWFDTPDGRTDLLVRARTTYDGATPSPSSVMLHNCLDLFEITADRALLDEAARALAPVSAAVASSPVASINSTRALARLLALDPTAIARAGMTAEAKARGPEEMVEIFADAASVTVPRTGEALVNLELRIAEGLHINAHDPNVPGLVGLEVEITGGRGVLATVEYPRGEPYTGGAIDDSVGGPLMAHIGAVRLPVRLSRILGEPITGAPRLMVTWQACDDDACYEPAAMALDIAIEIA